MGTKRDLKEALTLLRSIEDYGTRQWLGIDWCDRVDKLFRKYPAHEYPETPFGENDDQCDQDHD